MSDWSDLIDLAGDLVEAVAGDKELQKALQKGRKFLQKAGRQLSPDSPAREGVPTEGKFATAQETMLPERPEPVRLVSEPMVPENMTPEDMTPERLQPQNRIPEGMSAEGRPLLREEPPAESEALRYLTHICNQGMRGAMITNEILEPPLALRSGYLARYRRRMR